MVTRLPCAVSGRFRGTRADTFALYGADNLRLSVLMMVFVLSRTMSPRRAIPSPVAVTATESRYSLLANTVCVTRGCAELAFRTKTVTGEDEPG